MLKSSAGVKRLFSRKLCSPSKLTSSPRRTATASAGGTAQMAPYSLYTWSTPNGWKAHFILEELGLEYDVKPVNITQNIQKEDWYLKLNPNGKIPALVDHANGDLNVFESGAIMWYLCEKHDKEGTFWPKLSLLELRLHHAADFLALLDKYGVMFGRKRNGVGRKGGIGPMGGQVVHFVRAAKPQLVYAQKRYTDETARLFGVLESQLSKHEWLAADQYTIADMANFSWVAAGPFVGVDSKQFPNLTKWIRKIYDRPAVQRGLNVVSRMPLIDMVVDDELYNKILNETKEKMKAAEEKYPSQGL